MNHDVTLQKRKTSMTTTNVGHFGIEASAFPDLDFTSVF